MKKIIIHAVTCDNISIGVDNFLNGCVSLEVNDKLGVFFSVDVAKLQEGIRSAKIICDDPELYIQIEEAIRNYEV